MIAFCSITFVVVSTFLILDLDEKFYPKPTERAASIDYTETPSQTIIPQPIAESTLAIEPVPTIQKSIQKTAPKIQMEPKYSLAELEQKQFQLNLSGEAFVSGILKKANLLVKLEPIQGTGLKQFKVVESRLILDGTGVAIVSTGATINDTVLKLDFTANNVGSFSISSTLDNNIIDDANRKQIVKMKDQNFYLVKKETPYRLNLIGTLSS
ncbi:MAG: hypothetical protein FJ354_03415 [Thaumarchaeota archaeon]|nr:hypothetical protein [Nitrososphaerota archaeon]